MENGVSWALFGAIIGAIIAGIGIWVQLGTANKARSEAIYERLLSQLNDIVWEMDNWNGKTKLPLGKKRMISRMLHTHLDSLVESIAIEGRSGWRGFLYRLPKIRERYKSIGDKWYLEKHRYQRFENWYTGTLALYNSILDGSYYNAYPKPNYVEEVFHPQMIERDQHHGNKTLLDYFKERSKLGT